jgi:hypothetical protein
MSTQTPIPAIDQLAPLISTSRTNALLPNGRQGPPDNTGVSGLTAPPTAAGAMTSRSRYTTLAVNQS